MRPVHPKDPRFSERGEGGVSPGMVASSRLILQMEDRSTGRINGFLVHAATGAGPGSPPSVPAAWLPYFPLRHFILYNPQFPCHTRGGHWWFTEVPFCYLALAGDSGREGFLEPDRLEFEYHFCSLFCVLREVSLLPDPGFSYPCSIHVLRNEEIEGCQHLAPNNQG